MFHVPYYTVHFLNQIKYFISNVIERFSALVMLFFDHSYEYTSEVISIYTYSYPDRSPYGRSEDTNSHYSIVHLQSSKRLRIINVSR